MSVLTRPLQTSPSSISTPMRACACRTARGGPWRRLLAYAMARFADKYEGAIGPTKERVFGSIEGGTVLELGPGAGSNLPRLAGRGVDRWIGIEPMLAAHPYLERRLAETGLCGSVVAGIAEALPVPSASVDAVVSTLVLCSVHDLEATLHEIRRVLRPGGRFVFVEHVAAPEGDPLRRHQQRFSRVWRWLADGCHPNRDTGRALESAGFADVRFDAFRVPNGLLTPHIAGVATV